MNKLMKFIKEKSLLFDVINVLLGVALVVLIILVLKYPYNEYFRLAAFTVGGFMNMSNGLKYLKDSKKKNLGMNMMMVGLLIIIMGIAITIMK